jgi:hypothetical protein
MVRRRTRARKKRSVYQGLSAAPARRGGAWVVLVLGALVVVNLYVFVWDNKTGVRAVRQQAEAKSTPALAMPSAPLAPVTAVTGQESGDRGSVTRGATAALPAPPPATTVVEGKVGKADTLGKLLKKSGLTAAEADEIIRALSGVVDFRTIRAGQSYRIERGSDGRVMHFELELSKSHHVRADRQLSGELVAAADAT